jgi:hypothetical protein
MVRMGHHRSNDPIAPLSYGWSGFRLRQEKAASQAGEKSTNYSVKGRFLLEIP